MAQNSIITDAMKKAVGVESPPVMLEIEKGAIASFAEAIGDDNPIYFDEAYSKHSPYGGIIAPPTFLRRMRAELREPPFPVPERTLDGGSEWEYFEPVRAGDTVTAVSRLAQIFEKTTRLGAMLFQIAETTYTNEGGKKLAIQRSTLIRY